MALYSHGISPHFEQGGLRINPMSNCQTCWIRDSSN
uniref:Uncharacterized protein n=1 Tax=Rhizophora mucronata TaxID=61149 RepID=A0A2P2Q4N1_RHIMU